MHSLGVLLEELRDPNKVIWEHIGALPSLSDLHRLEHSVGTLQDDMRVIRAAVIDQSHRSRTAHCPT